DDVEDRENEKGRLEEAYEKCDRDLDELIVQHYTELTTAIRTYQSITERITNSRNKIKQVKENLLSCKMLLHCKRDELRKLWIEGIEHKHVLNLLDEIENIKQVPQKLEQCMASKHYLSATDMLVSAVESLEGPLLQVEGLSDLRLELHSKKMNLHLVLIEDLHRHLYIKSTSRVVQRDKEKGKMSSHGKEASPGPLMDVTNIPTPRKFLDATQYSAVGSSSGFVSWTVLDTVDLMTMTLLDVNEKEGLFYSFVSKTLRAHTSFRTESLYLLSNRSSLPPLLNSWHAVATFDLCPEVDLLDHRVILFFLFIFCGIVIFWISLGRLYFVVISVQVLGNDVDIRTLERCTMREMNLQDIKEDLECDPEESSTLFMGTLIQGLARLKKIPETVKAIKERLEQELKQIVKRSTTQVADSGYQRGESLTVDNQPRKLVDSYAPTTCGIEALRVSAFETFWLLFSEACSLWNCILLLVELPDPQSVMDIALQVMVQEHRGMRGLDFVRLLLELLELLFDKFNAVATAHAVVLGYLQDSVGIQPTQQEEIKLYDMADVWVKIQDVLQSM
ncbi:hypothetical protein STEG23_036102, partial [Scotinomys teguina]